MSPVRPRRRCNSAVWASSPSNINANHCSHSINIERRVQFTSDLFLMNLDGSAKKIKKTSRDDYFWIEKTFLFFFFASLTVGGHAAFNFFDLFLSTFSRWFCVSSLAHTADLDRPRAPNQCQTNGGKSAVLILGRQDGWQLTVKINLCSCLAPSEGCPRVSRIRGQPSVSLDAAAPQRSTPPDTKTRTSYTAVIMHRVYGCVTQWWL